jgi:hypothetical protein
MPEEHNSLQQICTLLQHFKDTFYNHESLRFQQKSYYFSQLGRLLATKILNSTLLTWPHMLLILELGFCFKLLVLLCIFL